MKKRMTPAYMAAMLVAALALAGCAQLGLTKAPDFRESALIATNLVDEVTKGATDALRAKQISSSDAENVLKTTDLGSAGIAVARQVFSVQPAAGQAKLQSVIVTLTGLQAYLALRTGAKK